MGARTGIKLYAWQENDHNEPHLDEGGLEDDMRICSRWLLAVMLLVLTSASWAHHGWSAYDNQNELTLTGTVVTAVFEWPHAEVVIDTGEKQWRVVLAPPSRTRARGLLPERVTEGATVTVVGYPHRVDEVELRAERIIAGDETIELR